MDFWKDIHWQCSVKRSLKQKVGIFCLVLNFCISLYVYANWKPEKLWKLWLWSFWASELSCSELCKILSFFPRDRLIYAADEVMFLSVNLFVSKIMNVKSFEAIFMKHCRMMDSCYAKNHFSFGDEPTQIGPLAPIWEIHYNIFIQKHSGKHAVLTRNKRSH